MKKYGSAVVVALAAVIAALLLVLVAQGAHAAPAGGVATVQYASEPRAVTATGSADVKVLPDQVVMTLGVNTESEKLDEAKDQNQETMRRVMDIAKDHGVKDRDIQTEYLDISPSYDYTVFGKETLEGYQVNQTVMIKLSDLSKFEDLLADLVEAGVNSVYDVAFQTSELRKYRDQARELAVQAAKEKAQALAGELGQDLGDPLSIVEQQNAWLSGYGYGWGSRYDGSQTQNVTISAPSGESFSLSPDAAVAPGQITVSATVNVAFELR